MLVRFILNNGAGLYVINPKTRDISISKNRENNTGFLRTKMNGKIVLTKGDYDLINNRTFEQRFDIALQRRANVTDNWSTDCISSFYKTDCEIDETNKIIEVKSWETKDEYEELINKANDKKDLIKLGAEPFDVDYYKYGVFQVYERNSTTITNITKGHFWESNVNSPVDSHDDLIDMYFGYVESKHRVLYASGNSAGLVPDASGYWTGNFGNLATDTITNGVYSLYRVGDRAGQYDDPNTPSSGTVGFTELRLSQTSDLFDDWDDFESVWTIGGTNIEFIGTWFDGSFYRAVFRTFGVAIPSSGTLVHVSGATNTDDKEYIAQIRSDIVPSGIDFERWGVKEGTTVHYIGESKYYFSDKNTEIGGLYKSLVNSGQFRMYEKEFYVRYLTDSLTVNGVTGRDRSNWQNDIVDGINYNYVYRIELTNALFFLSDAATFDIPLFGKFPVNAENNAGGNYTPLGYNVTPIAQKDWFGASIWMYQSPQLDTIFDSDKELVTLRHGYKLQDCFNLLIQDIDSSITFDTSQFFLNPTNPITGANNLTLFITPKSNIINYNYSRAATKFELSLNDIILLFKNAFNCQWNIENGSLIVEHRRYYRNGGSYTTLEVGSNLEVETNPKNGVKKSYGQNKYRYKKEDLPYLIEFGWMDETSQAFEGADIEILSKFVNKSTKEDRLVNNFITDLSFLITQGESISIEGAFLMGASMVDGRYLIPFKSINTSSYQWNLNNGHLSNYYLVDKYHRDDLPASSVVINLKTDTAYSVKRSKLQTMTLPLSDVDDNKLILTANGYGEVDSFEVNVFTNEANINTRHDNE